MTWDSYYRGDGHPRDVTLPAAPPWRTFPRTPDDPDARAFRPPEGLADAVNAALCLRRPLLLTGMPGSGKSTMIKQVARELRLGRILHWHVTSRSVLTDALYRYDALGRIYAQRVRRKVSDDIGRFLELGPLGTALVPSERPRALLIDELDKSDLDLPGDLLDVLERGEFTIPEIIRETSEELVTVRMWHSDETYQVRGGHVQCTEFPFIVMTSNGEQELPPAFLRRCIRFRMPDPRADMLRAVIRNWLAVEVPAKGDGTLTKLVESFVERVKDGETLAIDQLLNTVYLLAGADAAQGPEFERLKKLLMEDLSRA